MIDGFIKYWISINKIVTIVINFTTEQSDLIKFDDVNVHKLPTKS